MNPFTRYLLDGGRDEDQSLQLFVENWDNLEALVIRVFRQKRATQSDEIEYYQLRGWLLKNYSRWQDAWQSLWQASLVGGIPAIRDPFLKILKAEKAADFIGDWETMQHLPAARETINRYIQTD